ncbi:MAG: PD-(D/E)XK nuclease family protein [Bacteroidota bacterium]
MQITFGLQLDEEVYPLPAQTNGGQAIMGQQALLRFFETHFGLSGYPNNNDHLRIESYRQALVEQLKQNPAAFYQASLTADQLATSAKLLEARDELLLSGWDFQSKTGIPERLQSLANVEHILQNASDFQLTPMPFGFADRFEQMLRFVGKRELPLDKVLIAEPHKLLPTHLQRLFERLQAAGIQVEYLSYAAPMSDSDLGIFQQLLSGQNPSDRQLKNDGSLLILKAKRETEAANYLARMLRLNPNFRPLCLIPEKNRALDNALIQEGLPSLGILSASLARPSLQILKLATTFFWNPIDPYKILEFVSLQVKPLEDRLASLIASQIARLPGMKGEGWYALVYRQLEELQEREQNDKTVDAGKARFQYEFWFERKRYDLSQQVPVAEVHEVFQYLSDWAYEQFDEHGGQNSSLLVLSEQAQRICDLLEALPINRSQLSYLELERIVRTIYEPSPVLFRHREVGHYPCVHSPASIIGPTQSLIWWNFTSNERDYFFSRWYRPEIDWLLQNGIFIQGPKEDNARLLWQRIRPVLHTQKQLLLIMPEFINGKEVFAHPLHDELEAAFGDLSAICSQISDENTAAVFAAHFNLPGYKPLSHVQLGTPKPFLHIQKTSALQQIEQETFTSLDALFYYPYQWALRYKIKLRKSSILSVVGDTTLMGNLSHRFLEMIFKQNVSRWSREALNRWIDEHTYDLLVREGAVLLMYGREPEKINFINRIKFAAWSLISMIQDNGWTVEATEMDLQGNFQQISVKAKADLVLRRGDEWAVVDLKWRGATRRQNMIRNEEDIQLVMYAHLIDAEIPNIHTAYFILESGLMIARNNLAFKEALAVSPDLSQDEVNQRIWKQMRATFDWRMAQLKEGRIEVRTAQTVDEIEETYGAQLMDLLEMRREDAPFDDYRTLVNLIS